jgi:tRNA1(Val) A37 N6-methylase TrmN6
MNVRIGKLVYAAQGAAATGAGTPIQVSEDAFLGGAITARQPRAGYRAGVDAVLLAAAVTASSGRRLDVLDLGAGVGVVGLCVARRLENAHVTLLEREPELADLARDNVRANRLGERVSVREADLGATADQLDLPADGFDHILANPPFFDPATCRPPRDPLRASAHVMPAEDLETWLRVMARLARPGGVATVIHRADSLAQLLAVFERRFGGIEVRPIMPRQGSPASRVLVRGCKGSRARLQISPPIVLHDHTNAFRPDVARVLRGPVGLTDIASGNAFD